MCIRAFVRRPANLCVAGNLSRYILVFAITGFGTPKSNYLTNFLHGFWKISNIFQIKVCLRAVNTIVCKTDIKILTFDHFIYIPLHGRDHRQVVYECISVAFELTAIMVSFFTFIIILQREF